MTSAEKTRILAERVMGWRVHFRNTALYVQDTVKLGEQWRVMAGLRADNAAPLLCHGRQGTRDYGGPALCQGLHALFQIAGLRSPDGSAARA